MAIPFSAGKAVLVAIANSLAVEATAAGKASLSTALTQLSSEINGSSIEDLEFYGPIGHTWGLILETAADTISTKFHNTIADKQTIIADKQTVIADKQTIIATKQTVIADKQTIIAEETVTIDNHLNRVQSVVEDLTTTCSSGPHFRIVGGGCENEIHESEIARAMMVLNLKETNKLPDLIKEVESPTRIGHLPMPHDMINRNS